MSADALPGPAPALRPIAADRLAVAAFGVVSILYFAGAVRLAATAPFWMDEILTLWTARLPDTAAIWSALRRGAEFTPPLYDLLIHALTRAGITDPLALRLPSILAVYVAALATGTIAWRRAGIAPAALAAGVVLSSGLFGYAVQMRPYALVTACLACALALYDRPGRPSGPRVTGIATLLATAIGLHFYALLLAGALALLEFVRAWNDRRPPNRAMLAAIVAAGATILLWLPILIAARAYSGGDVLAPDYYARPVLLALVRTYAVLVGWLAVPLIVLLIANLGQRGGRSALMPTALILAAVPVGVFLFALLVSHSYADRYALAGAIGIALLFAALAQQLGARAAPVSAALLGLMIAGTALRDGGEIAKADRHDALSTIAQAPGGLPIVTGSGLRFFEARENVAAGARLVFLDPPGAAWGDPTNRNQLLRWKAIDPTLPVRDARAFLCATPAFYLFAQPGAGGDDPLPAWLARHADVPAAPADRASLTLVRGRGCPAESGQ